MNKRILSVSKFILLLALSVGLTQQSRSHAQSKPEPSAIFAIAPIDDQLKDVEYMANATSEAIGQMSGLIRFQAQGFMPGVDFSKPAGALLYFESGKPEPDSLGFFPVKNLDDVLDKISEFAELEEDGDTVTILPDNGQELTLKSKDGYAFVSDKAAMLENLPSDPASLVASQAEQYNFSAQVFLQRIPEDLRNQALKLIREGLESTIQQSDELQAELQAAQFEMQMKQMELMINDVEKLFVGFNVDEQNERLHLDFNMRGGDGSELEKRIKASKISEPSKFAGFLMENAAMTFHNCSGISKEDAEIYIESLESVRDKMLEEEESETIGKIASKLTEVAKKTLENGVLDMGGVIFTDEGFNAAFGGAIADARELENAVKAITVETKSQMEKDGVSVNLNSGTHAGFNLHEIAIEVDEEELDESVTKMFGKEINVLLAINESQVYIGVGKNPEKTLKKSIDANASNSNQPELIGQYNFFITPIMDLVAQVQTEEEMVQILRDKIAEAGKDRIRMTYDVVDGELKFRMEVQDGIFQMMGVAAENMGGMGGGGADF